MVGFKACHVDGGEERIGPFEFTCFDEGIELGGERRQLGVVRCSVAFDHVVDKLVAAVVLRFKLGDFLLVVLAQFVLLGLEAA